MKRKIIINHENTDLSCLLITPNQIQKTKYKIIVKIEIQNIPSCLCALLITQNNYENTNINTNTETNTNDFQLPSREVPAFAPF